jgi:hypothetical protein
MNLIVLVTYLIGARDFTRSLPSDKTPVLSL